jgi:hypothetical protein
VRKFILLVLFFLILPILAICNEFIISGRITDMQTKEPLEGVNIYVLGTTTGTTSDREGKFSLSLQKGTHTIVFSFTGYQPSEIEVHLEKDQWIDVMMGGTIFLTEVVISADRSDRKVDNTEMGSVMLSIESLKKVPAFMGEVDVLRYIQLLPGVQSAGDGNTGFFVRGGNTDQNLVLLDDAVVFNSSHLFNFFSVFNADAIKDLKLYKGGIHPEYGGRLSSVLDIRMREGDMHDYSVTGGIGLISSRLTLEGPIQKSRSSFMLSGRRTYADMFMKFSPYEAQRDTRLYFYDLNGKFNYIINSNNRLYFSGYTGRDVTSIRDLFGFDWGNTTASLRWNTILTESFFADVSFMFSQYQFNMTGDVGPAHFRWNSRLHNISPKINFSFRYNDLNVLTFGVQSILHKLDPGTIHASMEGGAAASRELSVNNGLEHGIYIHNQQSLLNENLLITYGLRGSIFQVTGPGFLYVYNRDDPNKWAVEKSIELTSGKVYQTFSSLEPRLGFRYKFNDDRSLKGNYNHMTQYIQQAQSAQSVAPYDVWFPASNNIPPQHARQVSLGYFSNLPKNLETSIEMYYKDIKNITDIIDNGNILGNEYLEGQLRTGKGWAYGVEWLLQKPTGKITGFAGYTWAMAERRIDGINNGRKYFAPNDRRHDLSMSGTWHFTQRWSLGMNFIYATGTAITLPVGRMVYQGSVAPIYANRNSSRLPEYHRLDVSFTYTPSLRIKSQRRFESSWNFSLFNVYGRANPISVSFTERAEKPGAPASTFFYIPGPIPAITWNFNY